MATRTPGGYADARALKRNLERASFACEECGFEDSPFRGEWDTRAATHPHSGNLVYHLTCPDCRTTHFVGTTL